MSNTAKPASTQTASAAAGARTAAAGGVPPFTIERVFDATPERLWEHWTDPAKYAKWLNPGKHDLRILEWDLRVGGACRFVMPLDDGSERTDGGVFFALDKPRRIQSGAPDKSFLLEATFTPVDAKRTRVTVVTHGMPPEWHAMASQGWGRSFDKLALLVAPPTSKAARTHGANHPPKGVSGPATYNVTPDRFLHMERWFNAPPERVYKAWTSKELLPKFFWPVGEGVVKELSAKVGGRLVMGHAKEPWTATWAFKELVPNRKIVVEDHWDDGSGHTATGTMEFAPENGGTRMTVTFGPFPKTGPYQPEMAGPGFSQVSDRLAEEVEVPGPGDGFRLVRHFLAPPEKVWEMWTTKKGLDQWWALAAKDMGYAFRVAALDVRVGGSYDIVMSNQEHGELHNHGEYLEVEAPRRLAYRWDFDIFLAPGESAYPVFCTLDIERTEPWGPGSVGTKMTFTQGPMAKPDFTEGSRQGVRSNFAKMEAALAKKDA
jgi:uncharacterized protein YndB with AHSA1/START domain